MSSRTSRTGRRKKPNAALYVGYVEDDETPEMIMKKFAVMEQAAQMKKQKLKEKQNADPNQKKNDKAEMDDSDDEDLNSKEEKQDANGGVFDDAELAELFNNTSYYSLNSLQRNNDCMFQKQTVDADGFVTGIDDPNYAQLMFEVDYDTSKTDMGAWMRAEEDDYCGVGAEEFWGDGGDDDDEGTSKSSSRRRKTGGTVQRTRTKARYGGFVGHNIGSKSLQQSKAGEGKQSKTRLLCHEPFYMKVPAYPVPRSWLKPVGYYKPRAIDDYKGCEYVEKDILSMTSIKDFTSDSNKKYVALLMDPPFDLSGSEVYEAQETDTDGHVKLSDFAKLPINLIIPESGMLFIWVPSELTIQINDICESWGFILVEHATWILRNISYEIENRDSKLLGISKVNLMLYRRTKSNMKTYGRLELRHQRTSDSYFDFARFHRETGRELKSNYHYKVIETLLPDLDHKEQMNAMFLWAPRNERRDGWHMISDTKQLEILYNSKPNMHENDW